MAKEEALPEYHFYKSNPQKLIRTLGKERLIEILKKMLLIRNFEIRGEAAYQQGKVGGFYHSYIGQEAIQTAAVEALGTQNWWTTTYRCHALAILLGEPINSLMAELYGKVTGNALGRGGSMHFFSKRMLGGFGIVGGHIPLATGAAFTLKYKKLPGVSLCFLGEGAVGQGAFHEALNLASLWNLPCIFVIENNHWGMGTAAERAICVHPIAEKKAIGYGMKGYTVDGMSFFDCYSLFEEVGKEVQKSFRPVLIEAMTDRFRGHSISDPALYRSKEELEEAQSHCPIHTLFKQLEQEGLLKEEDYKALDKEMRAQVIDAMKYADESLWPDPLTLGEGVYVEEH